MVEGTEALQARLAAISEKTAKISTIVTTIMKIAQQTNLISLNAAIEAENAGELGLGFAVVAKEVRRLADQTAKASKGIEQMVKEMQSTVGTAVMGMDGFAEDIRSGSTAVQQAAGRMGGIIERVEHLVPQFDDVRQGMSAQAHGASQIADGVRQIVDASQETSQSVRQTNDAITQLTRAAQELQAGISRFRLNGAR
jgi:methyl-accepting chemotaxis protein WspA